MPNLAPLPAAFESFPSASTGCKPNTNRPMQTKSIVTTAPERAALRSLQYHLPRMDTLAIGISAIKDPVSQAAFILGGEKALPTREPHIGLGRLG